MDATLYTKNFQSCVIQHQNKHEGFLIFAFYLHFGSRVGAHKMRTFIRSLYCEIIALTGGMHQISASIFF